MSVAVNPKALGRRLFGSIACVKEVTKKSLSRVLWVFSFMSVVPVDVLLRHYLTVTQLSICGGSHSFFRRYYFELDKVGVQIFHIIRHFVTDSPPFCYRQSLRCAVLIYAISDFRKFKKRKI